MNNMSVKKIAVFATIFISVFLLTSAPALAAEEAGIKPGSFFYGFVTTFEKINLFFTFSPEKKAEKALRYAEKRLAEAEAVADEENSDAVKTAISGYEKNIALAAEASKKVKDETKAENLLNLIAENTSKHQEVLADVLSKVPDEAKEAITKAIEASKKGQEEALKQVAELKSEVEQLKKEIEELKKQATEREKPEKQSTIPKSEIGPKKEISQQIKKSPDDNVSAEAKNFSTSATSALLTQSKSYQDLVDLADGMIRYIDVSLDNLTTEIAQHEGIKQGLSGNAPISDAYISDYKADISKTNEFKKVLVYYRDIANQNVSLYKKAALEKTSKFINEQEFISTIETLQNDTNWDSNIKKLSESYDSYVVYRKNRDNYYVKVDATFRALFSQINESPTPSVSTYQPQTAPQFQMPQLPKTTSCTLSGDGGVGLQAYMNCITY